MHRLNLISVILLLILAGCGRGRQSVSMDDLLITVDVTASYPKKELILQDFMDVEYIPLETNNEFLCEGRVMAVGKDIMLITNHNEDGDLFIYDLQGKAIRKINRKGKGGEEYSYIFGITLDENNDEMFVNDHTTQKILVYDLEGSFKRYFKYADGLFYDNIYNFDDKSLICDNSYLNQEIKENRPSFIIISKHDGNIMKEVNIFSKEKKAILIIMDVGNNMLLSTAMGYNPIIPHRKNWILTEPSSDTIYRLLPDYHLAPFAVRTPSIQSMNPEVFLVPWILTERYFFMKTEKKEYDFQTSKRFPSVHLMYDNQENKIFTINVYNDDYINKKEISLMRKTVNNEIAFWQKINSDDLLESLEKGHLKGRLKEIAEGLEEESNPVIMLVKHKKD